MFSDSFDFGERKDTEERTILKSSSSCEDLESVNSASDTVISYRNNHAFVNTNTKNFYPVINSIIDHNKSRQYIPERKVPKRNKIMVGISVSFIIMLFILWIYRLVRFSLENSLYNLLYLPLTFLSLFILLFPIHIVISGLFNMLGSTEFYFKNTKYYSCTKQPRYNHLKALNHHNVTIQIPIYKEDFDSVIKPTLKSAMLCRKYYDRPTENDFNVRVNIFVNDDGLQLLDKQEANKRLDFYRRHGIGYVARPKENRAGRFKKASNMNFGLHFSKIYTELLNNHSHDEAITITRYLFSKDGKIPWADGEISIGDHILLLDSDTRIPFNCLHDVLKEFDEDPNLGFTQHLTYPMIVTNTYWEKFIAHFTTLIYDLAMPISVAGGDVSPLVGHCAILKTSALRKLELKKQSHKIWSEDNVSEDFKLFMELTEIGYYGRYIVYTSNTNTKHFEKHNFMEGISLEYIDELAKFKKYAYGTCEILFNPFNSWYKKGIIGQPIKDYCSANIEYTSKLGIISYLFTYVAIAMSLPMSFLNFFTFGWVYTEIDTKVLPLYVILQICMLFSAWGTFTNSVFKARILRKDVLNVIWYNIEQTPFYILFFGSLPYHLILIMVKYFLNTENIVWGSTRKELEYSSRIDAIWMTLCEFKYMYIFFSITTITLIILTTPLVPHNWRIVNINAVIPLAMTTFFHMVGPLLLNPYIMTNNKLKRLADLEDEYNLNVFINETGINV